jgi:heat shock protein HtpX
MNGAAGSILVYDRIARNRRDTWLLLSVFAVALIPAAAYLYEYLTFLVAMFFLGSADSQVASEFAREAAAGAPDRLLRGARILALGLALIGLSLTVMLSYLWSARIVLRTSGARPVDREQEPFLTRLVENLCIGSGLPQPALLVVESAAANAFSTGLEPEKSSLVVTRGLIDLLDRREMEGVLAREVVQIGGYDTHLKTALAAIVMVLWLPINVVRRVVRFFFRLNPVVGWGCAIWIGLPILLSFSFGILAVVDMMATDPTGGITLLILMSLPVYAFVGAPLLGLLVRSAISREQEYRADADAVLLTRNPGALASALRKMGTGAVGRMEVNPASAHLFVVDPLERGTRGWSESTPSHPPLARRIEQLEA